MLTFLEYLAKSPLIGVSTVDFDKTMIDRALKTFLGLKLGIPWADLAYLSPAVYPELARSHRSLDPNGWRLFGLNNYARPPAPSPMPCRRRNCCFPARAHERQAHRDLQGDARDGRGAAHDPLDQLRIGAGKHSRTAFCAVAY